LGFNRKNLVQFIKRGSLVFPPKEHEDEVLKRCAAFREFQINILEPNAKDPKVKSAFSYSFIEAVGNLAREIDIPFFFATLSANFEKIVSTRGWISYHDQFKSIGAMRILDHLSPERV
jgi:hypothetical protein